MGPNSKSLDKIVIVTYIERRQLRVSVVAECCDPQNNNYTPPLSRTCQEIRISFNLHYHYSTSSLL